MNTLLAALSALVIAVGALLTFIMAGTPKFTKEGERRTLTKVASTPYVFWSAIMKSMGKKSRSTVLPKTTFVQHNIELNGQHIKKYRDICNFPSKDSSVVPLTYPYTTIFPIQALLLVDKSFPFPAMGLVHLANNIEQMSPMKVGEKVTASVRFNTEGNGGKGVTPHAKGYCFDVISEIYRSTSTAAVSECVWRCTSTYLYRTRVSADADTSAMYESKIKNEDCDGCLDLKPVKLPAGFGLKYAAVSGDYNPIHLYNITAKLFGFPRGAITHGMWSVAACCAEIMPDDAQTGEIYVEMKMPMYLPANAVMQGKDDSTYKAKAKGGASKVFQIMMKGKKGKEGEMTPHVRGTCTWK